MLHPSREDYVALVRQLRDEGFWTCVDLCGVDYLGYAAPRDLPVGTEPERFEVVVMLVNHTDRSRLRLRVQVPADDAVVPSLFEVHPGVENPEREVFDMFGLHFDGPPGPVPDPDARRVGGPPAAQGLRRRPHPRAVQGSELRPLSHPRDRPLGPAPPDRETYMTTTDITALDAAVDRLTGDHTVLRMSETEAEERSGYQPPTDEGMGERMIMNMGPQHPSTHGVLRLVLEMDGETITRSKPVIGYLHTGMEKTGEELTYLQGPTNVTRMDYASPLFNELVFSLAVEQLLEHRGPRPGGVDPHAHDRAQPDHLAHAVHGHQRHGPGCGVDDALRLARARGAAAVLRDGHRSADEPQLHPPRRRGCRSARRLGATSWARCSTSCPSAWPSSTC